MKLTFPYPRAVASAKTGFLTTATIAAIALPCLSGQNFVATDQHALNTPAGKTLSVKTLAEHLCAEQHDEPQKARALYVWVTMNIEYVDSTGGLELWATPEDLERQRPHKVLQNRTAVCQGYANLFCALAKEAGMPCEVVSGVVKNTAGDIAKIGHAWAAAQINGEWRLFDPTWGAPSSDEPRWQVADRYFMADPRAFVAQHLPDDPVWQLLETPLTERQFRGLSEEEIISAASRKEAGEFKFKDTLNLWFAMDSASRWAASESRVLRFNGSNERVLFSLGQRYWSLFFEIQSTLDSLTNQAILTDTLQFDTLWFDTQLKRMDRCHTRARALFERLKDPERIEKAKKFYTPDDVAALLDQLRGDLRTGLFEHLNHTQPDAPLSARQIAQLYYQFNLANEHYQRVESTIDCAKMKGMCFDMPHNRSLMAIQLAQHEIRFVQGLTNENLSAEHIKAIRRNLRSARSLLISAIDNCERMRRQPFLFAFVDDRIVTARQWLGILRTTEIRAERTALSPELEAVLTAKKLPSKRAGNLVENMLTIATAIEGLTDSLKHAGKDLGNDFVQISHYNLQLENFALQFNYANLLYRIALNASETAATQNTLPKQRAHIRYDADRALQALRKAASALDFLEGTGRMPAASATQKRAQVEKLTKALRDFLKGL